MSSEFPKTSPAMPLRAAWGGDGRLKKLFANAGILLGGKGLNAVFSLGAMAVAARALGTEAFGTLILIHTFTQAMGEIAKFQSWQAVLRYGTPALMEGRTGDFQRLLRFTVALDGLSAVVGMLLSMALGWVIAPHLGWSADLMPAVLLYATSMLFMVTATPTGVLRLVDRFDLLSVQGSLGNVVRLLAGGLVWLAGGGMAWFLAAWYLGTAVAGLYLILTGRRELKNRGLLEGFRWRGGGWTAGFPGIWAFVWSTNLNTTLELAFTHVSTLIVGWLLGPAEAALFRVARQIGEALAKPAKLLVPAIYPELAKLCAGGEHHVMRSLVQRSALMAAGGASLSLALAWLGGEWLLGLVLGPDFVAAYPVMLWLVASAVVSIAAFPLEPVLISGGEAGAALRARLWSSAFYLPVLLLAVQQDGLIGAGWARLFATVVTFIAFLVPVMRWFRARTA
ncbi:lipopolysaccharide biosynthesis protein [Azospirillum rugosum]|uniref:O-antigen/teichoic acid export membrane protein n=1 Tax=Azospirillum rugosum TaxID=416170 RepID=A0ABS4SLE5_9PROT|nr:lipopolysaccharide biosynthesis protein [Azospirillum rugosum]MBP2293385.1 O-antigen/teichoic acid export membrane protein [Azospirillum rugosum]